MNYVYGINTLESPPEAPVAVYACARRHSPSRVFFFLGFGVTFVKAASRGKLNSGWRGTISAGMSFEQKCAIFQLLLIFCNIVLLYQYIFSVWVAEYWMLAATQVGECSAGVRPETQHSSRCIWYKFHFKLQRMYFLPAYRISINIFMPRTSHNKNYFTVSQKENTTGQKLCWGSWMFQDSDLI